MRTFKFRAWNGTRFYDLDPKGQTGMLKDLVEEKHWKVMQYTGLKDKNGKSIYEGDRIRCDGHSFEEKFDAIVEFGRCQFRESRMNTNLSDIVSIEVIGNIYENPELLK
jgi:uncharacterized phage protein (TIGR01671 family)